MDANGEREIDKNTFRCNAKPWLVIELMDLALMPRQKAVIKRPVNLILCQIDNDNSVTVCETRSNAGV